MTEKIDELLCHIRTYHLSLAYRYSLLAEYPKQPQRIILIAHYLSDWELSRVENLSTQLRQASSPGILNTWLKEKPQEPSAKLQQTVENQLAVKVYNEEELIGIVSEQHNGVADTYRQLAEIAATESMQEFFENLAAAEVAEIRKTINHIREFELV